MGVGRIHGPTTDHDGRTQLVMRDDRLTKRACELGVEVLTPDDLFREIGFSRPRDELGQDFEDRIRTVLFEAGAHRMEGRKASQRAIRIRPRTAAAMTVRAVGSTDGPVPGIGK
jgi:hypothetical protein